MIARRKPLQRSTKPLKRVPIKRKWPMRRVSKKLAKELRLYSKLRAEFLDSRMICEAFAVIWPESTEIEFATEVHHRSGRGKHLNDVDSWLPVGRTAHAWIHANANKARALGLLT